MSHHDELTAAPDDYCFAKPGQIYAIYLPSGGTTQFDLGSASGTFSVQWFNPRTGGKLQKGTVSEVKGPGSVTIGLPPEDTDKVALATPARGPGGPADWVALIKLK
jgi:hypothetical protein